MWEASAPGKVILFGEHAVVYGRTAVACAVNLRTHVRVSTLDVDIDDPRLSIQFKNLHVDAHWKVSEILDRLQKANERRQDDSPIVPEGHGSNSRHYLDVLDDLVSTNSFSDMATIAIKGFLLILFHLVEFQHISYHILVNISTDLPIGAGLGSSASFSVALCAALLRSRLCINHPDHVDIPDIHRSLNENQLSLINKWAFVIDSFIHGKCSGIDNSIITFGGCLSMKQGLKRQIEIGSGFSKCQFMIVYTGISRRTIEANARVATCLKKDPHEIETVLDEIENIAHEGLVMIHQHDDLQMHLFNMLIRRNQRCLEQLCISNETIDSIVQICEENGLASKITGAGCGGSVLVVLSSDENPNQIVERKLTEALGLKCWRIHLTSTGVQMH